jgi:hypothetical protein
MREFRAREERRELGSGGKRPVVGRPTTHCSDSGSETGP